MLVAVIARVPELVACFGWTVTLLGGRAAREHKHCGLGWDMVGLWARG